MTIGAFDVRPEVVAFDLVSAAMALGGPGPLARAADPAESHQAADSITATAREESERFVLDVLKSRGPMTDDLIRHVARQHGAPWSDSRLRTARKQLQDKGLVADSGIRAKTESGRLAAEWMVTE